MHVVSFLVRSGKYSCRLVPLERFSDHQRIAQSTLGGNINVSCLPASLGHTVPSTSCIPYKHFIFKVHGILLKELGIQEVQSRRNTVTLSGNTACDLVSLREPQGKSHSRQPFCHTQDQIGGCWEGNGHLVSKSLKQAAVYLNYSSDLFFTGPPLVNIRQGGDEFVLN